MRIALVSMSALLALLMPTRLFAQELIEIVPTSSSLGGCIPLANNVTFGFSGFVYRNVPSFQLNPGDSIRFDLGSLNGTEVRRDIYFAQTTVNPGPVHGDQGVRALEWISVVSELQTPDNAFGNTIEGDFELRYRSEAAFDFPGGGLAVGFSAAPPALLGDFGCEPVVVVTDVNDPTDLFYGRFFRRPHLDAGDLDDNRGSDGAFIGGMIIEFAGPPVADGGPDQTVQEGEVVLLDGVSSFDPDGDPLTFAWTQVAGPSIQLVDAGSVIASFVAPSVALTQTLTFELVVDDGYRRSSPDLVNVTVARRNDPPEAHAGSDLTAKEGASVALDGSASFDSDGDPLVAYEWRQVGGPLVVLQGADQVEPRFTAPRELGAVLLFQLRVFDGKDFSELSPALDSSFPDTVAVEVVANSAPVANAGERQTVDEGAPVTLSGLESFDPDEDDSLAYFWTQQSGPGVVLDDAASASPSFVAPQVAPGGAEIVFVLQVRDDDPVNPLLSEPASVVVSVRDLGDPPACVAAQAEPNVLWPPDHRMHEIQIVGLVAPDSTDPVSIEIADVTQNEAAQGRECGDSAPDVIVTTTESGDLLALRAERSRRGNGRVYQVSFEASNAYGSCQGIVQVQVPRDPGRPSVHGRRLEERKSRRPSFRWKADDRAEKSVDNERKRKRKGAKKRRKKNHFGFGIFRLWDDD